MDPVVAEVVGVGHLRSDPGEDLADLHLPPRLHGRQLDKLFADRDSDMPRTARALDTDFEQVQVPIALWIATCRSQRE
jgi:hypothetical protein